MDKTKAASIVGLLLQNDYEPTIMRDDTDPQNPVFTLRVSTQKGQSMSVLINQLKTFQDNNQVTISARVIDIT